LGERDFQTVSAGIDKRFFGDMNTDDMFNQLFQISNAIFFFFFACRDVVRQPFS